MPSAPAQLDLVFPPPAPGSAPAAQPYDRLRSTQGMVRTADPGSSHIAARRHVGTGRRQANQAIIRALVTQYPGRTSVELHAMLRGADQDRINRHELSRRLPELEEAGLIHRCARNQMRKCRIKRTHMLTWWPGPRPPEVKHGAACGLAIPEVKHGGPQRATEEATE